MQRWYFIIFAVFIIISGCVFIWKRDIHVEIDDGWMNFHVKSVFAVIGGLLAIMAGIYLMFKVI